MGAEPQICCKKIEVGENITEEGIVKSATRQRLGTVMQRAQKGHLFCKKKCQYDWGANANLYLNQDWDIGK